MISAGHGDVPLVRLRFRCLRCQADRLDFVVRGKDVVRPWRWCWPPSACRPRSPSPCFRLCSPSRRRKLRRRGSSSPSLPARIGRAELGTLGEAAPVIGRNLCGVELHRGPQSHMITSLPMREAHSLPTAPQRLSISYGTHRHAGPTPPLTRSRALQGHGMTPVHACSALHCLSGNQLCLGLTWIKAITGTAV